MSMPLTDEYFVSGIKNGDEKALDILYKMHYSMILHFIINNNGTEQEAKDIYQEAMIVLYEKIREDSFEFQCKIKTYLYSVCRRLWLKRLTEKSKFGGITEAEEFLTLDDEMPEMEEKEIKYRNMSSALALLGEPCKTLIEDFYINNYNMTIITEKFGYTNADNAKNQKYKCLMRLKKLFFVNYKKEI